MAAHVVVIPETLSRLQTKGAVNTLRLAEHIKSLAEQTDPDINADIRVFIQSEILGVIMVSAQIGASGDFKDQKVAEAYITKFGSPPWAAPSAPVSDYQRSEGHIVFTAYATVRQEHFAWEKPEMKKAP